MDLFLEYKKRPDRASLVRLLGAYQDTVYSVCYQVLRHAQDAEDASQEALIKAVRQMDSIEDSERFSAWLYRVALHAALDLRRSRGRRELREAVKRRPAAPPAEESHEALHQGLAELDDTSRAVVVEHYFGHRPLREIAAARGVSEQAVWKRIERAKERLKEKLGVPVLAGLEQLPKMQAPKSLLAKVAAQSGVAGAGGAVAAGGLAMAGKSGFMAAAILTPLVLLAGAAGIAWFSRSPEPPPPPPTKPAAMKRAAPARMPVVAAAPIPTPAPLPVAPVKASVRKPYPLQLPPPGWSAEAHRTWELLLSRRITLDEQNQTLAAILAKVSAVLGVAIASHPSSEADVLSMKVQDIVADGCLRLMLGPRQHAYEIRPDGSLFVGPEDNVQGGYEKVAREIKNTLSDLEDVAGRLDQGWDGLETRSPLESQLQSKKVTLPQGESKLSNTIKMLRDRCGIHLVVDYGVTQEIGPVLERKGFHVMEELSLEQHLHRICASNNLGYVLEDGWVKITSQANALKSLQEREARNAEQRSRIESLNRPFTPAPGTSIPEFADAVHQAVGLPVIAPQAVWENGAPLSGGSIRECLDRLSASGIRWALRDGKLYLVESPK